MSERFDAVVVGAGFAGLHMLWKLRGMGLSAVVIEKGADVGGTWYWNRYPGCRCDVPSMEYSVPWDAELDQEWDWTEKYSTQPEILSYAQRLADKHDLKKDIRFDRTVVAAARDEKRDLWVVETDKGDVYEAPVFISGAGALSEPILPDIPGIRTFKGELYHTGRWPKQPVDMKGKRVAVLGTGSTGVQACTAIAAEAGHLFVLQRTPQFSLPAINRILSKEEKDAFKANYPEHRVWQRGSFAAQITGTPYGPKAFDDPKERRFEIYEKCWNIGRQDLLGCYLDINSDAEVNAEVSEFARGKIRSIVKDPVVAEKLCPKENPIGTRRIIIDTGYFEIFNQPNVTLVDIKSDPIEEITETGVRLKSGVFHELDILVVATGYDALTGPLLAMNVTGRGGVKLKDAWANGPQNYLGVMIAGFPNLFTITGPGSPSVHVNVIYAIDQHVEWIARCLADMRNTGAKTIEPTLEAQAEWMQHINTLASRGLRIKDKNNWYLGQNVPGKPQGVMTYYAGLANYRAECDKVAAENYRGFKLEKAA
jgi:cyclohexanone monooxygenase